MVKSYSFVRRVRSGSALNCALPTPCYGIGSYDLWPRRERHGLRYKSQTDTPRSPQVTTLPV